MKVSLFNHETHERHERGRETDFSGKSPIRAIRVIRGGYGAENPKMGGLLTAKYAKYTKEGGNGIGCSPGR